jgi:hypothetical protein
MIRSAAERLTRGVLQGARHPLASTSYAVGVVRGLTAEAIRLAGGGRADEDRFERVATPSEEETSPQRVPLQPGERHAAEAAEVIDLPPAPTPEVGEPFANEPHAASRASRHGEGPIEDAEVDRWEEDAEEVLTGEEIDDMLPGEDEGPLLDPSVAKQVRSEAEVMQRGARSDKE